MIGQALVDQLAQAGPLRRAGVDQGLGSQDVQDLPGDGGPDRVMAVGKAVDEAGARRRHGVVDRPGRGHEPEWPVARGRALGGHQQVGPDAPVIQPEPAAGPTEPGHHLVGDEQDAVAPTDVGDRRPVPVGGHCGGQRGPHDGLTDEGRDRARAGRVDRALELRSQLLGGLERIRTGVAGAIRVRGAEVAKSPEPALVGPSKRLPTG